MEMKNQRAKPSKQSQRRLPGWDYASPGLYFVTICTLKRQWFFGKVSEGQMHRNQMGTIAHERWLSIPVHHENVIMDAFIIMPNHIHGILYLMDKEDLTKESNVATLRANRSGCDEIYANT